MQVSALTGHGIQHDIRLKVLTLTSTGPIDVHAWSKDIDTGACVAPGVQDIRLLLARAELVVHL